MDMDLQRRADEAARNLDTRNYRETVALLNEALADELADRERRQADDA